MFWEESQIILFSNATELSWTITFCSNFSVQNLKKNCDISTACWNKLYRISLYYLYHTFMIYQWFISLNVCATGAIDYPEKKQCK